MEVTQNDLAISTQGRGFWILDKINVLHEVNSVTSKLNEPHLFNPELAYRTNVGGGWRGGGGPGFENDFSFYIPKNINLENVKLTIIDPSGNMVVDLMESEDYLFDVDIDSNILKSGIHTAYWDLEYKAPKIQEDFVSMYYSASRSYGPEAVPGTYKIELSINEKVLSVPLKVVIDPRWDISNSDLQNQFDKANQVIDLINESQLKLSSMRQISKQVKNYIELTKEKDYHNELKELGNKVIDKIISIESELYQNKIKTSQDEINYARKWTNHITHLYDRITTDIQGPNDGMMKRIDELTKNYNSIISPYNSIIENELNAFTSLLKDKGVGGIIID